MSLSEVKTISDHINHKLKDHDDDDDIDDIKDENSDDNQHNNNSNIGIDKHNGEDITCGYGVNNNDENDENGDDVGNDNSNNDDDNLNNHHNRFCQRNYKSNEISPKRNLFSLAVGTAGGSGLIGVNSLDLLTNLATNFRNTELLINNARNKITDAEEEKEEKEKDKEIEEQKKEHFENTTNEVTNGADIPSIDAIVFLQSDRNRKISEDGEDDRNNVSTTSNDFDRSPFIDNVAGRPSVTYGDDPSIPSTSRRMDQSVSFSVPASSNLTLSPTNVSTAHQSIYRGVNEQYVSALLKRIVYSIIECSTSHIQFSMFIIIDHNN